MITRRTLIGLPISWSCQRCDYEIGNSDFINLINNHYEGGGYYDDAGNEISQYNIDIHEEYEMALIPLIANDDDEYIIIYPRDTTAYKLYRLVETSTTYLQEK